MKMADLRLEVHGFAYDESFIGQGADDLQTNVLSPGRGLWNDGCAVHRRNDNEYKVDDCGLHTESVEPPRQTVTGSIEDSK